MDDAEYTLPGIHKIRYPVELANDPKLLLLVYRAYFDDVLGHTGAPSGHAALDGIGGPRTAVMIADTLFRDGSSDGAKSIHQALGRAMTKISREEASKIDQTYDNERAIDPTKEAKGEDDIYDYYVGRSSYNAIRTLVQQGHANEFTMALACVRNKVYDRAMKDEDDAETEQEKKKKNKKHYGPGDTSRLKTLLGPAGSLEDCKAARVLVRGSSRG